MAKKKQPDVQSEPEVSTVSHGTIEHATLIKWINSAEDVTADSRATSEKCRDYNDSKQWTDAEAKILKERGQAAIVINRFKPKMDGLFGMEKTMRTTAKCFPRTPKEDHDADAATEAIRFVLQDNFYSETRSAAFENLAIEGTGGCEVIVKKPKKEGDSYKIVINHVFWDRIIYDPHSRRKDFSDARWLGQVVWMDYDIAVATYTDKANILEAMFGETGQTYDDKPRWMQADRRRVKIIELYYRESGTIKYCCFTRGGYLKDPMTSPYVNEEGEAEWPYEFASANVDRDGGRYGPGKQLLDVQDEINKRRSKALHLLSVRQVQLERGAVDDVNKVKSELAKPDGVIETTPGMLFEILKTGDMATGQFSLLTEAKQEIDAVGFNAAVSGKLEGSQSGVALKTRQMAGQTELAPLFAVLKHFDMRVYKKVWNCIRKYWTDEMWIRVTDDEQNIKFVGLNKKITKGDLMLLAAKEKGAPPEALMQMKAQIEQNPVLNQPMTHNNVAELDVDIQVADAPDVPSMEVEQFQGLAEVIKSGAPPALIEVMVMSSAIPHKERVLKNLRGDGEIPEKVKMQMQQMREEMKKLQEENQKLKTDDAEGVAKVQAQQQNAMAKLQTEKAEKAEKLKLDRESAEAEFTLKKFIQEQELLLARQKVEEELAIERDRAAEQIRLEREKAEAQIELEKMRIAAKPEPATN